MRIALDAMGGDYAPDVTVEAAVTAARLHRYAIALVGPKDTVEAELRRHGERPAELTVCHAPDVVAMGEHPATAVRQQPQSSIAVGVDLVRRREADAFVSMGNTGAVMAYALLKLGRLRGIERPALSALFPTRSGVCLVLDVGANADCRPTYLLQFGQMGAIYAEHVLGIPSPRVGLLNIGEEEGKGNQLAQETYRLLKNSGLRFVGNVEAKDIPRGLADVVVTDGFSGNVALKMAEGVGDELFSMLREALTARWYYKLAAGLLRPAFRSVAKRIDYSEYGGVPLLGANGLVLIGHGRSNAYAVQRALVVAAQAVEAQVVDKIAAATTSAAGEER